MPFGARLQELIHRLESGTTAVTLRWGLLGLAMLTLFLGYNWRGFRNMNSAEAMDAAQLARNLAEGRGYSTLFIRPLSIYLLTNHHRAELRTTGATNDPARLKSAHPDLANPPLYPLLLAGLMKVLPLPYDIPGAGVVPKGDATKSFWNRSGSFWWYPPDFIIALFNELLLIAMFVVMYLMAQRLFDASVAWLSAILLAGTELLWRFSVSGLPTTLAMLMFVGVAWCLMLLERESRQDAPSPGRITLWAAAAGLITGLMGLTRYSFLWLIIPVALFVVLFSGRRRALDVLVAVGLFAAVVSPWIARNYHVCGSAFGTSSFAVMEATPAFGEYKLQRSLAPDLNKFHPGLFWYKLLANARQIISDDLPRLGGNWFSAFFLVGLLLPFKNIGLSRLRYFVLFCVPVLIIAQALGRTALSDSVPGINSENLLVILTPLVLMFGVSLFFVMVDQFPAAFPQARYLVIGVFSTVACLPMILTFLPPRSFPIAYPPYFPPVIQTVGNWMKEDELMMSDVPWAVAWYGRRQCVWLTLTAQEEFFALNDYLKPVKAVYLTPETMDSRFLSQWIRTGELSWGSFIIDTMLKKELPPTFPLRKAPAGFLPEQFFLTDRERWRTPPPQPPH